MNKITSVDYTTLVLHDMSITYLYLHVKGEMDLPTPVGPVIMDHVVFMSHKITEQRPFL